MAINSSHELISFIESSQVASQQGYFER